MLGRDNTTFPLPSFNGLARDAERSAQFGRASGPLNCFCDDVHDAQDATSVDCPQYPIADYSPLCNIFLPLLPCHAGDTPLDMAGKQTKLAKLLKDARVAAGLSQTKAALTCSVSSSNIDASFDAPSSFRPRTLLRTITARKKIYPHPQYCVASNLLLR